MKFFWFLLFLCVCVIVFLELSKSEVGQEIQKAKFWKSPSGVYWVEIYGYHILLL